MSELLQSARLSAKEICEKVLNGVVKTEYHELGAVRRCVVSAKDIDGVLDTLKELGLVGIETLFGSGEIDELMFVVERGAPLYGLSIRRGMNGYAVSFYGSATPPQGFVPNGRGYADLSLQDVPSELQVNSYDGWITISIRTDHLPLDQVLEKLKPMYEEASDIAKEVINRITVSL